MKGGFKMALKDNITTPSGYIDKELEKDTLKETEKEAKEVKKSKALDKSYEDSFSGEEKLEHQFVKIKSKIDIKLVEIDIDNIVTSQFKKVSRANTLIGLKGVVEEWGVVTPIHVLKLEHADTYMLLDGLRRVFASLRCGRKDILAVVWDFEDKEEGKDMANILSLMVNRSQHFTPKEMWEQMKVLEEVNDASPGLIEFLLQMNGGDAMKLRDVMKAEGGDFEEIKASLSAGELTIDGAYKKINNIRKKLDKLAMEDSMSLDDDEPSYGGVSGDDPIQNYAVEQVKEMLEIESDEDKTLEDMDMTDEVRGNIVQDVKDRKPIDKSIKQGTLMRDEFKCRCCGIGGHESWLDVLVYHHLIPVYAGGPDTVENGLTLCSNCHLTLHCYIMGKIHVDFDRISDKDKEIFKNIFKYGNVAIKATQKTGMKKEEVVKENTKSTKHMYPGVNLKDNKEAFEESKKSEV